MTENTRAAFEGLLDLVYPPKCLVCGTLGEPWLCKDCASRIERVPQPYCDRCGHPLIAHVCNNCTGRPNSFETARAVGEYSGVLRDAIHQFKYNGHRMLAADLAELMSKYLTTRSDFNSKGVDLIVPVPIHPVKKRLRGYNQSELLANELSRLTGIPASSSSVERIRQTLAQVELSREERQSNVSDAFKVASPEQLAGKKVLLIDDVSTTCSTVHECSMALRSGGAAKVQVLCLAFGS